MCVTGDGSNEYDRYYEAFSAAKTFVISVVDDILLDVPCISLPPSYVLIRIVRYMSMTVLAYYDTSCPYQALPGWLLVFLSFSSGSAVGSIWTKFGTNVVSPNTGIIYLCVCRGELKYINGTKCCCIDVKKDANVQVVQVSSENAWSKDYHFKSGLEIKNLQMLFRNLIK